MRKALLVGIDYYESENIPNLHGCVNDASKVNNMLAQNAHDDSPNFDIDLLLAENRETRVTRHALKDKMDRLFLEGNSNIALFYFSGHGYLETTGGWLCTSESDRGDDGVSLREVVAFANKSKATNKVIILDSCHSGAAAERELGEKISEIGEGVTVLTASTADQYALESEGGGIFTGLLLDALGGAAANLTGDITPGAIYAYIDQSLGAWDQRPVFKTNVKNFVSLRKVKPPLPLTDLRRLTQFFPKGKDEYFLDPTYEPDDSQKQSNADKAIPEHTEIFAILQKYNRVNLVLPVEAEHLYYAAMNRKSVRLTAFGRHYRNLVFKNRI